VNAFVTYLILGFFGAARWGASTEGNILQNKWLGGGVWQGLLNVFMCREFRSEPFWCFSFIEAFQCDADLA
jgi:hypothetical protein